MKKLLLIVLFCSVLFNFSNIQGICADVEEINGLDNIEGDSLLSRPMNKEDIKAAIAAYKEGDFLTCISILKEYTEQDENNAVAWYYLAGAYMNIAMVSEANAAFDKVIMLDSVPKLTSYAIQAQMCMKSSGECKYEKLKPSEIQRLKENPTEFMHEYYSAQNVQVVKPDDIIQIEKLINGSYENNIHPQAQDFILNEKTKIQTSKINSGK